MDEDGFASAELDLDGNAGDISDERGVMLDGHIFFSAETAADEHVLDEAVVIVDAEHLGALVEGGVGALVGGEELDSAVVEGHGDTALRLEEGVLRPRGLEMMGQHIF